MRTRHELAYDAPPSDVYAMLADPGFRHAVCEGLHALRHDVSVEPAAGDGMVVLVDQTQPARGIPSFAAKFVGEEIRLVQRETWTGPTAGSLDIEIPGKPGAFEGSVTLAAGPAGGTLQTVTGTVTVKVPLIGGRLEGLVADVLAAALRTEERVGRDWLARR